MIATIIMSNLLLYHHYHLFISIPSSSSVYKYSIIMIYLLVDHHFDLFIGIPSSSPSSIITTFIFLVSQTSSSRRGNSSAAAVKEGGFRDVGQADEVLPHDAGDARLLEERTQADPSQVA